MRVWSLDNTNTYIVSSHVQKTYFRAIVSAFENNVIFLHEPEKSYHFYFLEILTQCTVIVIGIVTKFVLHAL